MKKSNNKVNVKRGSKAIKISNFFSQLRQEEFRPHITNFSLDFHLCPLLKISNQFLFNSSFKNWLRKTNFLKIQKQYVYNKMCTEIWFHIQSQIIPRA